MLSGFLRIAIFIFGRSSALTRLRISKFLGKVAERWIPVHRKVADDNLKIAFPRWDNKQRRQVIAQAYCSLICSFLDLLAMARCSKEDIISGVEQPLIGGEKLDLLRKSGQGFIIVTGHTGSWEWGGAFLASIGVDLADVAKPLNNPAAERFVSSMRDRFGIKIVSSRGNIHRLVRHIKGGGVLSLLSDQNARKSGIFVPFFGRLASTVPGAGYLSYKLNVPVLPVWGFKVSDGKIRGFVDDPIWPDRAQPMQSEIERITKSHVASLERFTRDNPGQYLWFHRRWKTRPAGEAVTVS